jgi:hypothetical protein
MGDEWRDGASARSHHMQMLMSGWLPPKAGPNGPTAVTLNTNMQMLMSGWLPPKAGLNGPTAVTLNTNMLQCMNSA